MKESKRGLIREFFRVLFVYDEEARLDLFKLFPWLKQFFLKRRYFAFLRSLSDIIFTGLIILGLFGPQDRYNPMLFVSWGVWWTSIVLSWFFVGRMWCAVCPFPGIGRILQYLSLSLNKVPPRSLAKYCAYLSTFLFACIIWTEAVTHMKESPFGTALLLLSILFGATIFAVFFKGQAWCRHFCPMGKIIGSAATMSILEFRPNHEKCRECKTFACKRGKDGIPGCPVYLGAFNVRNNLLCLACGHCLILCDKDSPSFYLRHPLKELIINKGRYLTCAYIIPFLMASQLARFVQEKCLCYHSLKAHLFNSEALAFTVVLGLWFLFFLWVIRLGARFFTVYEDELFGRFSPMIPVLVPLAFTGELIYRLEYFLFHMGDFFLSVGIKSLAIYPSTAFVQRLSTVIMLCGLFGSVYVAYIFYAREFEGLVPRKNFFAIVGMVIFITALYLHFF